MPSTDRRASRPDPEETGPLQRIESEQAAARVKLENLESFAHHDFAEFRRSHEARTAEQGHAITALRIDVAKIETQIVALRDEFRDREKHVRQLFYLALVTLLGVVGVLGQNYVKTAAGSAPPAVTR